MTVPVNISNSGPYPFVIDTGAERTVISRELARNLRLPAGNPINVIAMSGRSQVNTVIVPSLTFSSVPAIGEIRAPALGAGDLGGLGLLGIDTLRDHVITLDFDAGTMSLLPADKRKKRLGRSSADEIVVTAKSTMGQLIVTDADFDGRAIRVIIDTGSPISVGNIAMRRLVQRATGKLEPLEMTSATGGKIQTQYARVGQVRVGGIQFSSLSVAFADVPPFERFGVAKRPAMLLGMNALRNFRRVQIDFANRQIRFQMPRNDSRGYGCTFVVGRMCMG